MTSVQHNNQCLPIKDVNLKDTFNVYHTSFRGPGSSVGIATDYVLDGPGIECGPGSSVGIATDYGLEGPGIECGPGSVVGIATGYKT